MPVQEKSLEYHGELDVPLDQRILAIRTVASASADANECAMLLDVLGLNPQQDLNR